MKENIFAETSELTSVPDEELSGIAKGAGIIFFGKIFGAIVQYVQLIVISKILGAEMLGSVLLGMTFVNLAGLISRFGLDLGVVKFVAQHVGNQDMVRARKVLVAAVLVSALSGVVVAVVLMAGVPVLVDVFKEKPGLKEVLLFLCPTVPFTSVMLVALAATQGAKIMRYTTYILNISLPLLNLLGVIVLSMFGFRLGGVIGAFFTATIVAAFMALLVSAKTFPGKLSRPMLHEHKQLFIVSLPLGLVIFLSFVLMWTDTIMLGYFKSGAEVGVYNTAMKTAMLTSIITISFNTIFAPVIANLHNKKEFTKLEELSKVVTKWIFTISLPVFFLMTLLSGEIMHIFGQEFMQGAQSLKILSFAQLINATVGSVGFMLAMSGRQKIVMYNSIIICILNVLLNVLLIPMYGMTGAAIASSIAIISVNFLMLIQVYFFLKMHPFSLKLLKPLLFGTIIFVMVSLLKSVTPTFHYVVQMGIYPLIFFLFFFGALYKWGLAREDLFILTMIKARLYSAQRH